VESSISNLIEDLAGPSNTQWISDEKEYRSFSEQYYKDHLHVYQSNGTASDINEFMVPFHKDRGLILFLTPFASNPLVIKDQYGETIITDDLQEDSMIVVLGSGLSEWLLDGRSSGFHAASHAVKRVKDDSMTRSVMARMKVFPENSFSLSGKHFGDYFRRMQKHSQSYPLGARELAWSGLQKAQCEEGTAYCWMGCYDLPDTCSMASSQCVNEEDQPCCTEDVTQDCQNMDDSCHWECKETTTASYPDNYTTTSKHPDNEKFCLGGTDMYMQGFSISSNGKGICVILLFNSWILDTKTKFILGCVGVVILGVAIEGLLALRRSLQSRKILLKISSFTRRVLIILLFGVNVGSGYFAMLVAMTYSVELFICMVAGLLVGHAIFNSDAEVGESVDPCCASQTIATGSSNKLDTEMHNKPIKKETCSKEKSVNVKLSDECSKDICYENGTFLKPGEPNADCLCSSSKSSCDCL